jgi:methionyl-tRNA synthetase
MPEEKPAAPSPETSSSTEDARISIDEFARVRMKVGQVIEAERIQNSRKLMKLKVDIGDEVRQVVAGIAGAYEAELLLNMKVVIVTNLKPAKLMGHESNGMVVAASDGGRPVLVTFAEEVPNGAVLT